MSDPGFVPQPRHTRPSGSDLRTSAVENALSEEIEGTLASEGYRLSVSAEGARLTAGSEAGLRNGRSTWRQLLDVATTDAGGTTTVPGIQVDDEPTYSWRGRWWTAPGTSRRSLSCRS